MAFNWRGILFKEKAQSVGVSPDETFERDASSAIRVYNDVDWNSRQTFVQNLVGYSYRAVAANGTAFVARRTPHYHGDWVDLYGRPFLYATKARIKGLSPSGVNVRQVGTFQKAEITATYQTLPWDVLDDFDARMPKYNGTPDESSWRRYCTKQVSPQGQFITINQGSYYYVDSVNQAGVIDQTRPPVMQGLSKLLVKYNLSVTWHDVPEECIPCLLVNPTLTAPSVYENAIGTVNSEAINGYRPGSLLLVGIQMKPQRSPFGNRIFDVTTMHSFFEPVASAQRPITRANHQFVYRPQRSGYIEVISNNSGQSNLLTKAPGVSIYDWWDHRFLYRSI